MVKNLPAMREPRLDPWVGKIPWRRKWQHTPVFWPGESHGQKSLVGYSPWGCKESDTTEQLALSLSPIYCRPAETAVFLFAPLFVPTAWPEGQRHEVLS